MTLSANAANLFYRKTLTQLPPTRLTLPGEATMSVSLNGINNASQTVRQSSGAAWYVGSKNTMKEGSNEQGPDRQGGDEAD
jgi:hypothetical protein